VQAFEKLEPKQDKQTDTQTQLNAKQAALGDGNNNFSEVSLSVVTNYSTSLIAELLVQQ